MGKIIVGERRVDIDQFEVILARDFVGAAAEAVVPDGDVLHGDAATVDTGLAASHAGRLDDTLVEGLRRHRGRAVMPERLTPYATDGRMSGCAPLLCRSRNAAEGSTQRQNPAAQGAAAIAQGDRSLKLATVGFKRSSSGSAAMNDYAASVSTNFGERL